MGYREDAIFQRHLQEGDVPDWLIPGWPRDKSGDPIDTENLVVISLSKAGLEFCCGGDWQEPRRMILYVKDHSYHVEEIAGETCFPDIEINEEKLRGVGGWLDRMKIQGQLTIRNHGRAAAFFNRLIMDLKKKEMGLEHDSITMERLSEATRHLLDVAECTSPAKTYY